MTTRAAVGFRILGAGLGLVILATMILAGCGARPSVPGTAHGMAAVRSLATDSERVNSTGESLRVTGNKNPKATFTGCWYTQGKNRYQAVDVSVANPGTYSFNAVLYYGTTCNKDDFADQFGFGQLLNFGGFDYIFWFTAFPNETDMSALWYVGEDESKCVNYSTAPNC